ncbi:hypothetical protein CQS02_03490 [Elizabethkingia miricola]|nr:hypothetical protein CQS02_03490 [Elizabethkingia miricola]OPC21921.1 hypothetical protein BAY00_18640 [Elizabethkingia bruuniana]
MLFNGFVRGSFEDASGMLLKNGGIPEQTPNKSETKVLLKYTIRNLAGSCLSINRRFYGIKR